VEKLGIGVELRQRDGASFVESIGIGLVANGLTKAIRDSIMHQLEVTDIETWESYIPTPTRPYSVPDHIQTLCPHCEREGAILRFSGPHEIQLACRKDETPSIEHFSILGKARCNRCKLDSDIILHGYKKGQTLNAEEKWSEIWIHPKPVAVAAPEGTPKEFAKDYQEAVGVLSISPNASAALARRGIERVLREHYGVKEKTLNKCMSNAIENQMISSEISEMLDVIRKIGNYGAHARAMAVGGSVRLRPGLLRGWGWAWGG
jgi:hypothetical protein